MDPASSPPKKPWLSNIITAKNSGDFIFDGTPTGSASSPSSAGRNDNTTRTRRGILLKRAGSGFVAPLPLPLSVRSLPSPSPSPSSGDEKSDSVSQPVSPRDYEKTEKTLTWADVRGDTESESDDTEQKTAVSSPTPTPTPTILSFDSLADAVGLLKKRLENFL